MSFAQDVKKEIANIKVDDQYLKAELYGFLKLKSELVIRKRQLVCEVKTNMLAIVRRISTIIKQLYKLNVEVIEKQRTNLDYRNIYVVTISDKCKEILTDLKIIDENEKTSRLMAFKINSKVFSVLCVFELTDEFKNYQGGYIWDFVDQGIFKDGKMHYGGDFKDYPNDNNFCANGLLLADRSETPKVRTIKYSYNWRFG